MNVVELGPESWSCVLPVVQTLLRELGDEERDAGVLDDVRMEAEWKRRPELLEVLAALDGGELCGLLTLSPSFAIYANGAYGVICEMYVVPAARSRGVGKALLDAAKQLGRARRWSRLDVTAPSSNRATRAIAFYEANGFTFAGPKLKCALDPAR